MDGNRIIHPAVLDNDELKTIALILGLVGAEMKSRPDPELVKRLGDKLTELGEVLAVRMAAVYAGLSSEEIEEIRTNPRAAASRYGIELPGR